MGKCDFIVHCLGIRWCISVLVLWCENERVLGVLGNLREILDISVSYRNLNMTMQWT